MWSWHYNNANVVLFSYLLIFFHMRGYYLTRLEMRGSKYSVVIQLTTHTDKAIYFLSRNLVIQSIYMSLANFILVHMTDSGFGEEEHRGIDLLWAL